MNEIKDPEINEPVLKKDLPSSPTIKENEELTFEFALNQSKDNQIKTAIPDSKTEDPTDKKDSVVFDLYDNETEDSTDEQLRKSRERIMKLKSLSYRIGTANISDMEKEPAYKRNGVDLSSNAQTNTNSRMSIGTDSNDDTQLRSNNSFLHDNVD